MTPEKWERIEQLRHYVLTLEPDERRAYLSDAGADDASLRLEVASLLSHEDQTGGFLEENAMDLIAREMARNSAQTMAPGRLIKHYEIVELLGKGGMGEVWLARDLKLKRDVAIKVLPHHLAQSPEFVARFKRESEMLAAINHPNIATIHDRDESDGLLFLVLEYLPGRTLADRLKEGTLPVPEARAYFTQIAEALKAAHARGIIHRDLKPANIRILPEGTVKVLDFGLARPARADLVQTGAEANGHITHADTLTRPSTRLGTPAYMSPEQLRGEEPDKATDLWAFGCMLYEALTGRHPFAAETQADTEAAILVKEPDWNALPPGTPAGITALLKSCLEKKTDRRLRDAGEAGRKLRADDDSSKLHWLSPARLRRNPLSPVIAALLLIIALLTRPCSVPVSLPAEKFLAVMAFSIKSRQSAEDKMLGVGLARALSDILARVPGLQVVRPSASEHSDSPPSDYKWYAKNLGANLILGGTVESASSRKRVSYRLLNAKGEQIANDSADGADWNELSGQVARRVAMRLGIKVQEPALQQAGVPDPAAQEKYLQALGYLQRDPEEITVDKAVELLEGLAKDNPHSALTQAALGRAYLFKYQLTQARDKTWFDLASVACGVALREPNLTSEAQVTLGLLYVWNKEYKQAVRTFEEAHQKKPDDFEALLYLAAAYGYNKQLNEAEAAFQQVIKLRPAVGYAEKGVFYYRQGRFDDALECWRRAADLLPENANYQRNVGNALLKLGQFDQAESAFRKSIALQPTPDGYNGLGTALFYQEKYDAAVEEYKRAIRLQEQDALLWGSLGDACRWRQGGTNDAEANDAYDHAIGYQQDLLEHESDAESEALQAEWLAKRGGRKEEALQHIEKALELESKNAECLASAIVVYHLGGARAQALAAAQKAVNSGYSIAELTRNPELAGLRSDPDFQAIINQSRKPR